MGACDISFTIKGKASKSEVNAKFKQKQEEDRDYNGSRDGYSGDFQTVDRIKFTTHTFTNESEAFDYCIDNCRKWDYAVSVYVEEPGKEPYTLVAGLGAC